VSLIDKSYKSTKSSLEVGNLSKPKLSLKVPSLPNTKIVFLKVGTLANIKLKVENLQES